MGRNCGGWGSGRRDSCGLRPFPVIESSSVGLGMAMSRSLVCFLNSAAERCVQGAVACALLLLMTGCKEGPGVTTPTAPTSSPPALTVSGQWSAVLSGLDAAAANGRLAVSFDHR